MWAEMVLINTRWMHLVSMPTRGDWINRGILRNIWRDFVTVAAKSRIYAARNKISPTEMLPSTFAFLCCIYSYLVYDFIFAARMWAAFMYDNTTYFGGLWSTKGKYDRCFEDAAERY